MYHRLIRLGAIVSTLCLATADLHAQSVPDGTFPLPETYFPALKGLIDTAANQSSRMMARNTENAVAEALHYLEIREIAARRLFVLLSVSDRNSRGRRYYS